MIKGLVSIIIPVYNGEKWLQCAIESAINQTYSNVEVICVDDGSTDASYELCRTFCENPKFRLFHKENGGQASARNYGLIKANGEFIQFLDCDDTLDVETCRIAVDYMSDNIDIVMYGFNVYRNNTLLRTPHCDNFLYNGEYERFKELSKLIASPCNKLYRREYLKVLFHEGCVYGEDGIFNYENLTNKTKIQVIDKCLYNVKLDNPNSVNKVYKKGRLKDTVHSIKIRYGKVENLFGATNAIKDYLPSALITFCFTVLLLGEKSECYKDFCNEMNASVYVDEKMLYLLSLKVANVRLYHKACLWLVKRKQLVALYFIAKVLSKIR